MALDIGPGAIDRATNLIYGYTNIDLANPANALGYLNFIELYFDSNASGVKVGTFSGSDTHYTPRDYVTIGNVTADYQTFSGLDIDVFSGDYLGIYFSGGALSVDTSGGLGRYYKAGDQFGAGLQTYTLSASVAISIYGTGVEVSASTVTTQAASAVTENSCTGNGNITATGGHNCTRRGFCYKVGTSGDPITSDSVVYDDGSFGTGAFTKSITGLTQLTGYRVRAYAVNVAGTSYGTTVQITTAPLPPTGVLASHNEPTKVVVSWTKSTGATGYRVYRDAVDASGLLGDVATFNDNGADPPAITPGSAVATDGLKAGYIRLSLSGTSASSGTSHTYTVRAVSAGGTSNDSNADTGCRLANYEFSYQWQRSAADSDASYSDITGAAVPAYNDVDAPASPTGRYYRCKIDMLGAAQQTSAVDRGYRKSARAPGNSVVVIIKNSAGETLSYADNLSKPGYDYRTNELGTLNFTLPADSSARDDLIFPNEAWLYIDGQLEDVFKIIKPGRSR